MSETANVTAPTPVRKRRGIILFCLVVIIAAGAVAALFPTPRYIVRGWVNGEAFYHGRPMSYWTDQLVQATLPSPTSAWIREWGGKAEVNFDDNPELAELLSCNDPDALPVVWGLLANRNAEIRRALYAGVLSQNYLAKKNGQRNPNLEKTLAKFSNRVQILVSRRFDEDVVDAMQVLSSFGPDGSAALPFLVMNMELPDLGMKLAAAEAICHIDSAGHAEAFDLILETMDEGPQKRAQAVRCALWYVRREAIMGQTVPANRSKALVSKLLAILPKVKEAGDTQCLDDIKELLNKLDPEAAGKAGIK